MRKIEIAMVQACRNGEKFSRDNTQVIKKEDDSLVIELYGNAIAKIKNDHLQINFCNWITRTTVSRVNALVREYCYTVKSVNIKQGLPYATLYNGEQVPLETGEWIRINSIIA